MKTLFRLSGLILALSCISFTVMAQDLEVSQGDTRNFGVTNTAGYTYHWAVSGGTSTNISGVTANQTGNMLWDGVPGDYTLSVYPENGTTNCLGDNQQFVIRINGVTITWDVFAETACPNTDNNTASPVTLTATFAGGPVGAGTWSFNYSKDGGADVTVSVTASNTGTVTLPGTDYDNASTAAQLTHTYQITRIVTPGGAVINLDGTEPDAANHMFTLTVEPRPVSNVITVL